MFIRVLGSFAVEVEGEEAALRGPQQRLVLALLVAARGDVVTTDQLIDRIWGDELPENPRKTVQVHIANLRSVLGGKEAPIRTEGGGYRLIVGADEVDADRFGRLVMEARSRLRADPASAARLLDEARALWRGPPYADLIYLDALQGEIRRLQELRIVAEEDRAEALIESGDPETAVADLELLTTQHPLRERPCGLLMLALYRTGQQTRALRAFRDLRSRLVEGLGIDPSPELQILEQRILEHDPDLLRRGEEPVLDLPSGTVTFMFTEIDGSTRLWDEHPEQMTGAVAGHDRVLRTAVEEHEGYVFSTPGDGFAVAFPTAVDAMNAAVAAQRAVAAIDAGVPLAVRMGIHTGEAMLREGDYFGAALNRCARVMAVAHGGQALVSAATAEVVRDRHETEWRLRDLGEHRLRDLSRPEHIFQLEHPDLVADFPVLRTVWASNLPSAVTSFVGRREELAEVGDLVRSSRLVTLTGPAGSGKTRLAIQAAAGALEDFPDGAWLVELAALADAEPLADRVGRSIGVTAGPGMATPDETAALIGNQRMLVVIDNCEHLVGAVARLVDTVLARCRELHVLATSREVLGLPGEVVLRVPPMKTPAHDMDALAVRRIDSVRLFTERAASVRPDFAVTPENVTAVVDICRRLDGLPLAIELAVARLRVLSPMEIAARLDDRFRLLGGGSRRTQPRHDTMLAALEWSYDLLDEEEQLLFQRLGTFAGSWNIAAAERVCAHPPLEQSAILDVLAAIVDKSMVTTTAGDGPTRYRMLQTIREFASACHVDVADRTATRMRHLEHFCEVAERLGAVEQSEGLEAGLQALAPDHDDLRAALRFSIENDLLGHAARIVEGAGRVWLAATSEPGSQPERP